MKTFEKNIINLYGEKGRQWLDRLPNLVTKLASTYGLSNLKPVNNLSYNYVLSGFQGPQPIILKLGLDIDGFKREAPNYEQEIAGGVFLDIREKPVSEPTKTYGQQDTPNPIFAQLIKRARAAIDKNSAE